MEIKKNITSIFMVPTLRIPKDALRDNGFINGYSQDEMRDEQYEDAVHILFLPNNVDRFREFLDSEYERTKSIIEDYDYEDGYVVVVYKLDAKFKKDFNLVKKGKYSKTSKEFQEIFPRVVKIIQNGLHRDELSLQFRVFNKTPDLVEFWEKKLGVIFDKDQEIWEGYSDKNEILNMNKIREYV
jgi:hypothetical protein